MENSPKQASNLWQSSAWSFGSLVKSLASKSEEVLHSYQRDLQEFGLGLKKETAVAAEVTAHVVKDLPASLENTAAVAQESLEAVGQTIEDFGSTFWRGTAELIDQVKEAVKKVDDDGVENSEANEASSSATKGRYSRYEAQLNALQCDSSTYGDEPEDQEDYSAWKSSFDLGARKDEMENLLEENVFIKELYARIVPDELDDHTFWSRYFYRLNKLQQAEDARADLVKRAAAVEEDLTWEVDEENDGSEAQDNPPPEQPKATEAVEEDVKSDNSAGSEWLVVQEERESDDTRTSPTSAEAETKHQEELERTGDKAEVGGEKDEDWGEWE